MDRLLVMGLLGGVASTGLAIFCRRFSADRRHWLGILGGALPMVVFFVYDFTQRPAYEGSLLMTLVAGVAPVVLAGWIVKKPPPPHAGLMIRAGVSVVVSGALFVALIVVAYLTV